MRMKAKVNRRWESNEVEILFYTPDFEGNIKAVGLPMEKPTFEVIEEGRLLKSTLSLPEGLMQSLVDECYEQLGMMPNKLKNKYKYDNKVLEKVEDHLRDMRRLVFKEDFLITRKESK